MLSIFSSLLGESCHLSKKKAWSSARFSHHLNRSNTDRGLLLTDWPEDKCRSRGNRTHLPAPSAHRHWRRPFTVPKFRSGTAPRQEGLWGQLGILLATAGDSPSFVFLCSPRSFCRERSSRDRCSYTTVGQRDRGTASPTPRIHPHGSVSTFILLPGAGRGQLGCRLWAFPIQHTRLTHQLGVSALRFCFGAQVVMPKRCFSGQWLNCVFVGQVPARLKQPESPVLERHQPRAGERFFSPSTTQPLTGPQFRREIFFPFHNPVRKTDPSSPLHTKQRTERAEQP